MTWCTSTSSGKAPRSRRAATCEGMCPFDAPTSSERSARRFGSVKRPVMPKSKSAIFPDGSTKRFPPCRSPWKIPCIMAPSRKPIMLARTTASVSMPAACIPSTSPKLNPSSRSITSMRRVTSVGWGRGTTKSRWSSAANVMAMSSMFSASRRKSSSSMIVSAKSSTRAGGLASAGDRDAADEVRGQPRHHGEVLAHPRRDGGTLHLHHHRRPVTQRRCVHLRDGCRGQRGVLDRREHRPDGPSQLLGEHTLDQGPRLGRDLVPAPLELGDQLGREDAVARGDDLAQLDVGRAEPLGRDPEPARDARDRRLAAAPPLLQVPQTQRAAEMPHRRSEPPAGGQRAATGQAGERGVEAGPHPGQTIAPGQRGRVDRPRAGVAERAQHGVGGRHDPSLRAGPPHSCSATAADCSTKGHVPDTSVITARTAAPTRTGRRRPPPAPGRAARAWPADGPRAT